MLYVYNAHVHGHLSYHIIAFGSVLTTIVFELIKQLYSFCSVENSTFAQERIKSLPCF